MRSERRCVRASDAGPAQRSATSCAPPPAPSAQTTLRLPPPPTPPPLPHQWVNHRHLSAFVFSSAHGLTRTTRLTHIPTFRSVTRPTASRTPTPTPAPTRPSEALRPPPHPPHALPSAAHAGERRAFQMSLEGGFLVLLSPSSLLLLLSLPFSLSLSLSPVYPQVF